MSESNRPMTYGDRSLGLASASESSTVCDTLLINSSSFMSAFSNVGFSSRAGLSLSFEQAKHLHQGWHLALYESTPEVALNSTFNRCQTVTPAFRYNNFGYSSPIFCS